MFGLANIYVNAEPGEAAMSATTAHSVVEPGTLSRRVAGHRHPLCAGVDDPAVLDLHHRLQDAARLDLLSTESGVHPSLEGYCNLFTTRTRQTQDYIDALGPPRSECDRITRSRYMVIAGPSNYLPRFINSVVIAFGSTFCAVVLGVLAAYGSRASGCRSRTISFILSTRMMPPIAVAIRSTSCTAISACRTPRSA